MCSAAIPRGLKFTPITVTVSCRHVSKSNLDTDDATGTGCPWAGANTAKSTFIVLITALTTTAAK
jgi:hypothetical protein